MDALILLNFWIRSERNSLSLFLLLYLLYLLDGTTAIKPTAIKPTAAHKSLGDAGKDGATPLIVKSSAVGTSSRQVTKRTMVGKESATFELYTGKAKKNPFKVIRLTLDEGRISLKSLLAEERLISLY